MSDPGAPSRQDLLLAIECSNPSVAPSAHGRPASVCVGRSGSMAVEVDIASSAQPSGRGGHDDDLLPAIERAVTTFGASPREIGTVAVSLGPGGYTSLRIAVAAAKMIALATGARLVGVPTALVAARASLAGRPAPASILVALASKNDAASLTLLRAADPDLRRPLTILSSVVAGAPSIPPPPAPRAGEPAPVLIADQFLPESIAQAAARAGYVRVPLALSALFCATSAERDNLPFSDPRTLAPIYAREPDAVTLWRARHGPGPGAAPAERV